MKKNYLLIIATMLFSFAVQNVFAQDAVYNDIDRAAWVATAPPYSPTDAAAGIDGKVAGAEYLTDGNVNTFLALVKPGKTYSGITGPASIEDLGFTIDLGSAQKFNYFRIDFRANNSYDYLRPWQISVYGSNGTQTDPAQRTWTLITDASGNSKINLPNAEGNGTNKATGNVLLENTEAYTSIKVVYTGMSTSASGSTLQLGEFNLGQVSFDKVIEKPADISFGDILSNASSTRTLTVKGANLSSEITYTKGTEEDAAAFTVTPGEWTNTGGTATITFAPTQRKQYTATLTINSTGTLEPQSIQLTGNADFDLPVKTSSTDNANENWYYIQFDRQAGAAKVLTIVDPVADVDTLKQMPLDTQNDNQLWKVTGSWDNYALVNKSGKTVYYTYAPVGEDPTTGNKIPEVNRYITKPVGSGDVFGFIRYQKTEKWQLKNTSSTLAPENKFFLNDISGVYAGGYSLNNTGNALRFIDAAKAQILIPADSVKLGSANQFLHDTVAVKIGAIKLTNAISASITEDADQVFQLKNNSVPAEGGDLEIVFSPKAYKKTSYATISLTSGTETINLVVSATSDVGTSKYYVGTTEQWGTPVDGEIVASIPVLKAGDVVWIAEGEYVVPQISVPANVSIYGGFSGREKSPAQRETGDKPWDFTSPTILKNSASLIFSIAGANTVIDGLMLNGTDVVGRAIQNISATAKGGKIRNCIMGYFNSNADGGAMNIRYETEIYNCLVSNNTGKKGGAGYFDQVTIHDCEIMNNSVPTTAAKPIGSTEGGGGGLFLANAAPYCVAYNLLVSGNTASFGGGIYARSNTRVYNSVIVNNTATSGSGVAFDERDSEALMYNLTIASNHATATAGSGVCFAADATDRVQKLYNTILWNNTDIYGEVYNIGVNESGAGKAKPVIRNIVIDDMAYYAGENPNLVVVDGVDETDGNKLFATDWVTAVTSPGKEKGIVLIAEETIDPVTSEIIPAKYLEFAFNKDFAGNARVGGQIDIGPYEDQSNVSGTEHPELPDGVVIDTRYYNIQGMEFTRPVSTGIYIKKETMDNQKVRMSKILFSEKNKPTL